MKDQARLWPTPEPGHAQRIRQRIGLHVVSHAPAHHLAAEQVDHARQIQPAFVGGDVGGAHTQHFARQCDRPMGLVFGDPGVPHSDSRAKYAVAFFKMSRSILTLDNSARSRASSICS